MSTQENGSLGLTKKAILKLLNTAVTNIDLKAGLTDEQIIWVKDKVAQIELWKDTAVTKLDAIDAGGTTLETRIIALETKTAAAQTKFNSIDVAIAAIKARLTAHGL